MTGTAQGREQAVLMPTDVSSRVGPFARFAGVSSRIASRAATQHKLNAIADAIADR